MKSKLTAVMVLPFLLLGMIAMNAANGQATPAKDVRIQKSDILKHPAGQVALKYADALHGSNPDDAMKLASNSAQARWKSEPASERKASTEFRKKMIPKGAELAVAIETGGVLIIEDGSRATLNVVKVESNSSKAGVVQSTSSTIAIPFVLEGGQWKLAR